MFISFPQFLSSLFHFPTHETLCSFYIFLFKKSNKQTMKNKKHTDNNKIPQMWKSK